MTEPISFLAFVAAVTVCFVGLAILTVWALRVAFPAKESGE